MNRSIARIAAILDREWADIRRNRALVFSMIVPPLILLCFPFIFAVADPRVGPPQEATPQVLETLAKALGLPLSALDAFQPDELVWILVFRQFLTFFLLIPVISALPIATHSVIGEKQNGSLEPLLATPIATWELLVGKCLTAAIPAVSMTWGVFLVYGAGVRWRLGAEACALVLTPAAWAAQLLLVPLIGTLGLGLALLASARSADPRTAQQIGVLAVLPMVGVMTAQMKGFFQWGVPGVFGAAAALALGDAVLLYFAVRLFQRETILTGSD